MIYYYKSGLKRVARCPWYDDDLLYELSGERDWRLRTRSYARTAGIRYNGCVNLSGFWPQDSDPMLRPTVKV